MTQHARITTLVAAALVTSLVSGACQAETAQQRGKLIAQGLCSRCHAIETIGDSPHPAAPRFVSGHSDRSEQARATNSRGLLTGHEDMPMFRFDRDDADAMVAYIRSIQGP